MKLVQIDENWVIDIDTIHELKIFDVSSEEDIKVMLFINEDCITFENREKAFKIFYAIKSRLQIQ